MDKEQNVFRSWIPDQLIVPLLVIALIPHIMILSIFNMNSTFTASFLDVDVDDIQFLFAIAYATIVCGLFVNVRFFQYFNIRNYCLFMTILNILLLFGLTITKNPQLILLFRIIQGPACLFEGCILLPLIMSRIKSNNSKIIAFSILYAIMLTGDKFTTYLVKFAIENYTHNMMIYTIMAFHLVALFIFLFLFSKGRLFPKKPLYQLNLGGVFLVMLALISGAFTLIYGKRYYWFESQYIVFSTCICFVSAGLFLLHQRFTKRPLFHFEVLKSKRVLVGLLMFMCFYILRSSMSNIYNVMNVVWKWEWQYVLNLQFYNVAGSLCGVILAAYLLTKQIKYKYIFIIGFLLLSLSMLWFSYLFVPDLNVIEIIPVLFIQGFSQGILFTPLVLFMVGSVNPSISSSASHAGVTVRFWSNTIGFAIMQNTLLHLTTKHQTYMTKNLDLTNSLYHDKWNSLMAKYSASHLYDDAVSLTALAFKNELIHQSLLITNIEIFRTLFVLSFLVVIVLIIYKPLSQVLLKKI